MAVTKKQARNLLGLNRDIELAAFFGVRRQAVYQWDELPELRELQLRRHLASARKPAKATKFKTR